MQLFSLLVLGGLDSRLPSGNFSFRTHLNRTGYALAGALCLLIALVSGTTAEAAKPVVGIHDSEFTRALDGMAAINPGTPSGTGTTGYEWWPTNWHYFVMPESVKEALRSDGTSFEVVSDADILAGRLVDTNGQPRYPIVISLASEAVDDAEIALLTNYVAAGGTLMVGGSAFTRQTNGVGRGDFAFANELGLHMSNTNLTNWGRITTFTKSTNHALVAHFPSGVLNWRMPLSSEDISWGTSPAHVTQLTNLVWQVQSSDAAVLARADTSPYLTIKQYGRGNFIYDAAMQPFVAHGGYGPGMYVYQIFRAAIQQAFANLKVTVPRVSPWPYPYDAAFNVRHDFENFQDMITDLESSAQFEFTNGAFGDYFFCTGTLRDEMTNSAAIIASLRRAVTNYGATIGPHNGGLKNVNNTNLVVSDYDYWHWGPDEALNVTPAGYASGKDYAFASISNAFMDVEGWLAGITNGARSWVAPYFNATREASYDIQEQLGVKIAGEQKISPFPHWTLSTQTPAKHYSFLSLPVSDWYVNSEVGQSTEAGHNSGTIHALVDYYYGLGALINLYSHSSSDGRGQVGGLVQDYIRYSLGKPRVWSTNELGVYQWWLKRGAAQVTPTFATSSNESIASLAITGATDPQTAVEVVIPQSTFSGLQVFTNGIVATGSAYRLNGSLVRILAGTTVTNVDVHYLLNPMAQPDVYAANASSTLTVSAPGVLANDTLGLGTNLTAVLVSNPAHGSLTLNGNGGFSYAPTAGFTGVDSFTYKANDGISDGNTVLVTISVANPSAGLLFTDDFGRSADPGPMSPWSVQSGNWTITGGALSGGTNASQTYGFAYLTNSWTNFAVEARIRFPAGAFGGGLGGCVNSQTGAHYAAWVYPEGSVGGSRMLRLIKFQNWSGFAYNGTPFAYVQQVALPSVGTNWHALKISFQANHIIIFYDGTQMIDALDTESQPYLFGGVSLDMWTDAAQYVMNVDDVRVTAPTLTQTITFNSVGNRTYGAAPFVPDVSASSGLPITLAVLGGPATVTSGNVLTLTGTGTVTLRASQPGDDTRLPAASLDQAFTVNPAVLTVTTDDKTKVYGAPLPDLTVSYSGFVNGETASVLGGSPALSTSTVAGSPVGTYPITAAAGTLQASNYVFTFVDGQLTVTPAVLNVAAYDAWRIVGQPDPPFLVRYNGFVNGDAQSVLSGAPALASTTTISSPAGTYPIHATAGTLSAANYSFSFADASLRILPTQSLFYDDFTRATNAGALSPWIVQSGTWRVGDGVLSSGPSALNNYSFAYVTNAWDDYSVEAKIRLPVGAFGGGIGARLNPATGTHYAAWVYPENSPGGANVLRLIKFQDWNNFGYHGQAFQPIQQASLAAVGTNWHSVKLSMIGTNLQVYFDSNLLISAVDDEAQPYTNGVVCADMWTGGTAYAMDLDEVDMEAIVQTQTITFANPGTQTYGAAPFSLGATASSGLPVSYTVLSGPAAIANGIITLLGTGNVTVRASQVGDVHFYAAADVDITFSVNPATITLTADSLSRVYGGANPALTGSLAGVVNGENITATYSTTADVMSPVDTYVINAALVDPENRLTNYVAVTNNGTLTITPAALIVTAANKTRTYGAPNPALTGNIAGIQNSDNITANYATSAATADPVGNYSIVPSLNDPDNKLGNYNVTLNNGTLSITAALLTGTANNASRLYGETNPVFTASYSGFVNGETVGILVGTLTGSSAGTNSPVGTYPITVSGQTAPNYTITYLPGTLTILPAPLVVQADDKSRGYGQTNPVFTASYSGLVNGENNTVLGGTLSFSTTADTNSTVGTYPIAVSGLLSTNYSITFSNGTLTVTPFALTVTADNQTRAYGTANPTLTGTLIGVQNGDSITASYSTVATPASGVGLYPIIPALADPGNKLPNYAVTIDNGTLTITPAALSVTAQDQSRLYGAANPTLTGTILGIQNNDDISATYSTTATTSTPVGAYAIVPAIVNPDSRLTNYTVAITNGTLTINPASLTATANNQSRLYGQSNPVFTISYSGFVNGENQSIVTGNLFGTTVADTNAPVGSYPITLSGQSAPNYTISYVSGTLTVLPASLLARADDKTRAYGQTNPVFTVSFEGFVNGESPGVLGGSALFVTPAQTNSPIGNYPIAVSGLTSSNYSLTFTNGTLTITPFALTVTTDNKTRTYGATNPVFTGIISGVQNGDNITANYASAATPSSNIGSYPIVPALIDPDGKLTNYMVTLNDGMLTVTAANLSVVADDKSRLYGAADPVFTGTIAGIQNSDRISATYSTAATVASGVGTYNIIPLPHDPDSRLGNYLVAITNGTLTIHPASLTVTANDVTKVYGQANPAFSVSYNGFVNGESTSALTGTPSVTTTATIASSVGTYPITAATGTLQASNYVFSFVPGQLTVTPAVLNVAAYDAWRVVNHPEPSFFVSYNGFVNGDNQSALSGAPALSTTATADSPSGLYPIHSALGTLSALNYMFTFTDASLRILPATSLFYDDFTRATNGGALSPWFAQAGIWSVSSGALNAGPSGLNSYSFAYVTNLWDDYSVETRIRIPEGAFGGGIGARLNPATGSHYAAWLYPENSPGGSNVLRLVKFQDWNNFSYHGITLLPIAEVNLASVGTNWHSLRLSLLRTNLQVSFDGNLLIAAHDDEAQPYTNGVVCADMWTAGTPYVINFDEVDMEAIVQNQTITFPNPGTQTYGAAPIVLSASASSGLPVSYSLLSGAASISNGVVTLLGTGNVTIRASQGGDVHYYAAPDVDITFVVNPAPISVTADSLSRVYGAPNPTLTGSLVGVVNGENITAAYSTSASPGSAIGSYVISAGLVDPENRLTNYVAVTNNGTLMITPAALTVTAANNTRTYGAANPALTGNVAGIQNSDNITANYTTSATATDPVGNYSIVPTLSDPDSRLNNYTVTLNNGRLSITPAPLTGTANNASRVYGQTNPVFTASYSGFVNGETMSILVGTLAGSSADTNSPVGTYPITVSGQTAPNYAITYLPGTLTILPAPLVVQADDKSRGYGQTNPVFTASYSGFVNGENDTVLDGALSFSTTADTNSPVGTYPVEISGLASTNYSITFSNGTLTVTPFALTVTAHNQTRAYGTANPTLTGTLIGVQNGDSITASYSTGATPASGVGLYPIIPALADPGSKLTNYSVTISNGVLTITPAALSVTAHDQSRLYGDANPVFDGAIVGVQNNDNITARYSTEASASSSIGTYSIVPALADPDNRLTNYNVSITNGTLTVNPAPLAGTANNASRLYGQTNPIFTVSYSGFVNGENESVVSGTLVGATVANANSPAGTYPINVSGQSAPNYTLFFLPGTLTVLPAPLVVQADDKSRAYGQTNPVFTASYSGFVNGESPAVLGGAASFDTPAQTNSPIGNYAINVSGVTATNYAITFTNGTLTITPFALSVTADNKTRTYGATNPVFTGVITGVQNGDHITASYSTVATPASNIGSYGIVPSLVNPDGRLTNYTVTLNHGTLSINPANLSVVAEDKSRLYGAANPELTGTVNGIQNSDNITASYSTPATITSGVGSYSIVPLLADPDSRLGNYTVSIANGALTINPALLTGAANNASRLYGQINPVFTVSYSGFVNGETETILTGALTGSSPATPGSPIGTYPITVSGRSAANYAITYIPGTLTINPAPLLVKAQDTSRTFEQTNPVFNAVYTGFVNGETAGVLIGSPALATTATVSSPVGDYPIHAALGSLVPGNYSISFVDGFMRVLPFQSVFFDNFVRTNEPPDITPWIVHSGIWSIDNEQFAAGPSALNSYSFAYATNSGTDYSVEARVRFPIGAFGGGIGGHLDPVTGGHYAAWLYPENSPGGSNILRLIKFQDWDTFRYVGVNSLPIREVSVASVGTNWHTLKVSFIGTNIQVALDSNVLINAFDAEPTTFTNGMASVGMWTVGTPYVMHIDNFQMDVIASPQTITFTDPGPKTYGDAPFDLSVTASSGLPVALSLVSGPATLSGNTITILGAGNVTLRAEQDGNINYYGTNADYSFTVQPALLTASSDNQTRVYGLTNPALTGSLTGVRNGENITAVYSTGATPSSPAGIYPINVALLDPENRLTNYVVVTNIGNLTVTPAALTVTADDKSRVYGSANPALTGAVIGSVNGDNITATFATTATAASPVGSYAIAPTLIDPNGKLGNYSVTTNNGTLTITQAALTGTANNTSRLYGQLNPTFTVTYTGFVNGEDAGILTGTLVGTSPATTNSPVGTYPITVSGETAANYAITYLPGTLAVNPTPLLVKAADCTRNYGQANPAFTANYTGFVNAENPSVLGGALSVTTTAAPSSPIGSYPIQIAGLTSSNYSITFSNGTLTVSAAALAVTADDQSRLYGSPNPTFTGSINGVQNGDDITAVYFTAATQFSPAGSYSILAALNDPGHKLSNYAVSLHNGTLTISRAALTVTADNKTRTYGASNPILTGFFTGLLNGDDITATYSTTATASSPVGSYAILPSLNDPDLRLSNYDLAVNNGTLTIAPAVLSGTAKNVSRSYGQTNPVFTASYSGFVNGENESILSGTAVLTCAAGPDSPAGLYPVTISGQTAPNYTINYVPGTLTVLPAPLVVKVDDKSRAYGQTNPVFTASYEGFVNGESNSVLAGNLTFSTTADTNSPVGTYPIEVSGLFSTNYSITFSNGALTITPFALTLTADNQTRIYGAANPAFSGTLSGVQNGDHITASYSTVATPSSNVGSYPIVPGLSDPDNKLTNYSVTLTNGMLTITPAALSVAARDQNRLYGEANPVLVGTIIGIQNSDNITATYSTVATAVSPIGTYSIVPELADPDNRLSNYTVAMTNGTLTINPAPLVGTANDASRLYGQINPVFAVTYSGFVNGENESVVAGTLVGSTSADTNSPVGTYAINVSGQTAPNYTIFYVPGTLTVLPASLLVIADNQSRVFSAPNPTLTYHLTGFVNGETTAIVGGAPVLSTTADATSPVGSYAIQVTPGTLSAANYQFTVQNGALQITLASASASLTSSQNPSTQASNVTFTVTLTAAAPASGTPTGSVLFVNNGTPLGGPVALTGGTASFSTASLPTGSNTISVEYAGDGNFGGTTNTLAQVVNAAVAPPGPLSIRLNADGTVTVTFHGTPGAQYEVQAAAELSGAISWSTLDTVTAASDGTAAFTDSNASQFSTRFYRAGKL